MNKENVKKGAVTAIAVASLSANILVGANAYKSNKEIKDLNSKITSVNETLKDKNKEIEKLTENNKCLMDNIEKAGLSPRQIEQSDNVYMTMTFYGEGAEENGGYEKITAYGDRLVDGYVASNVHPRGTKFYDKKTGKIYIVQDKGGSNFDSYDRLDVFVPRYNGESKREYDSRISEMGYQTKDMLMISPNE